MAGAFISKSAGQAAREQDRPVGDPFDRYVQLPLIFMAFLRAHGWPIAAFSHNTWDVVRENQEPRHRDGQAEWGADLQGPRS